MSQWGQQNPRGGRQAWNQPNQPSQQWGQPQWGPQSQAPWGQAPYGQQVQRGNLPPQNMPVRRRRNPFARLAAIVGFIILGLLVMTLISGLLSGLSNDPTPPPTTQPTQTTTSKKPTTAPSTSKSPTTGPTQRDEKQYQNEEYQVPPADPNPPELPMPETYGDATEWMTQNSIYQQSIQMPVRCEMSAVDLNNASNKQLQAHFNDYMACLMRVFGPEMESAGYVPVRPTVTVYNQPVNTRCGEMPRANAAYCGADQQVYYSSELPKIIPSELQSVPYVVETVIAHEFSHAIQGRTGILISESAWQQASDEPTANNISRRTEVQADCWAGQFNSAVGQSLAITEENQEQLAMLFHSIGDDQLTGDPNIDGNHGHGESRRTWYLKGADSVDMGVCNSFTAPDTEVK